MTTDTLQIARSLEYDAQIGERVHQVMWREKLTQNDVATQLGITQSALSRKLRGTRPWTVGELYALTRILRQPLMELMGFEPMLDPDDSAGAVPPAGFEPAAFRSLGGMPTYATDYELERAS